MAFANPAISDIIATTIQSRTKVIADNVTKNNALLMWASKRGNIKTVSGGNTIMQELSFAANGNAGFYSGYETLPIAAQDVISAAEYQWKQAACPITISGLEQLMNSGPERMIDLLESRINVGESSMAKPDRHQPLQRRHRQWWQGNRRPRQAGRHRPDDRRPRGHRPCDVAVLAQQGVQGDDHGRRCDDLALNICEYMNALWAQLVRGNDRPDLILMDNAYWGYFVASLQAQQRFTSSDAATRGFMALKYMDADVVLDGGIGGGMPVKTAYFLNTKYIFYRPHADRNMVSLNPSKR